MPEINKQSLYELIKEYSYKEYKLQPYYLVLSPSNFEFLKNVFKKMRISVDNIKMDNVSTIK